MKNHLPLRIGMATVPALCDFVGNARGNARRTVGLISYKAATMQSRKYTTHLHLRILP